MPSEDRAIRVFVSSTFIANEARRKIVEDSYVSAGMVPVGMERCTASTKANVEACKEPVGGCDWLVGIVAYRNGWIPEGQERSITEIEYNTAVAQEMPRLMFEFDASTDVNPQRDFDHGPGQAKQARPIIAMVRQPTRDHVALSRWRWWSTILPLLYLALPVLIVLLPNIAEADCPRRGCKLTFKGENGTNVRSKRRGDVLCTVERGSCSVELFEDEKRKEGKGVTFFFDKDSNRSKKKVVFRHRKKIEIPALKAPAWRKVVCIKVEGDAVVRSAVARQQRKKFDLKRKTAESSYWCTKKKLGDYRTTVTFRFKNKQTLKIPTVRAPDLERKITPKDPILKLRVLLHPDEAEEFEIHDRDGKPIEPESTDGQVHQYRVRAGSEPLVASAPGYVSQELNHKPSLELEPPIADPPIQLVLPAIILKGSGAKDAQIFLRDGGELRGEVKSQGKKFKGKEFRGLRSGTYHVRVVAKGWTHDDPDGYRSITIGSEDYHLNSELRRPQLKVIHSPGSTVQVTPPNGPALAPKTTNPATFSLEDLGKYKIVVEQTGHRSQSRDFWNQVTVGDHTEPFMALLPVEHTIVISSQCKRAVLLIDGDAQGEFPEGDSIRIGTDVTLDSPYTSHVFQAKCAGWKSKPLPINLPDDDNFRILLDTERKVRVMDEHVNVAEATLTLTSMPAFRGRTQVPKWRYDGCDGKAWYPYTSNHSFRVEHVDDLHLSLQSQHGLRALLVAPDGSAECIAFKEHQTQVWTREKSDVLKGTYGLFVGHEKNEELAHGYIVRVSPETIASPAATVTMNPAASEIGFETVSGIVSGTSLQFPSGQSSTIVDREKCDGWGSLKSSARFSLEPNEKITLFARAENPTSHHDLVLMASLPNGDWICKDDIDGAKDRNVMIDLLSDKAGEVHIWIGLNDPSAEDVEYRLTQMAAP